MMDYNKHSGILENKIKKNNFLVVDFFFVLFVTVVEQNRKE